MTTQRPYSGETTKETRFFSKGELVYGYHVCNPVIDLHLIYFVYDGQLYNVEVVPETVSQSTGRKDKHGVEIYGGMKCTGETTSSLGVRQYFGKIVWNEKYCCNALDDGDDFELLHEIVTLEIVPEEQE